MAGTSSSQAKIRVTPKAADSPRNAGSSGITGGAGVGALNKAVAQQPKRAWRPGGSGKFDKDASKKLQDFLEALGEHKKQNGKTSGSRSGNGADGDGSGRHLEGPVGGGEGAEEGADAAEADMVSGKAKASSPPPKIGAVSIAALVNQLGEMPPDKRIVSIASQPLLVAATRKQQQLLIQQHMEELLRKQAEIRRRYQQRAKRKSSSPNKALDVLQQQQQQDLYQQPKLPSEGGQIITATQIIDSQAAAAAAVADTAAASMAAAFEGLAAECSSAEVDPFEIPVWTETRETMLSAMDAKLALLHEREAQLEAELCGLEPGRKSSSSDGSKSGATIAAAGAAGSAAAAAGGLAASPGVGSKAGLGSVGGTNKRGSGVGGGAGAGAGADRQNMDGLVAALRQQLLGAMMKGQAGPGGGAGGTPRVGGRGRGATGVAEPRRESVFERWVLRCLGLGCGVAFLDDDMAP